MNNLPQGCTQSDIDRAFGGVVKCIEGCGRSHTPLIGLIDDCEESVELMWTCLKCARAIARQEMDNDE